MIVLLLAAPASAQGIVSNFPPLSPAEAVAVLRGSHSIADLTDYRSPGSGPTIVVMGDSTTPWSWPNNAFAPTRTLANDSGFYAPDYAPFYQPNYAPRYGVYQRSRSRGRAEHPIVTPEPRTPPRHIVVPPARAAGRPARGR